MATLHVKSGATGGGDGSTGSPYTLQEAFDNAAAGDEIYVWNDGVYEIDTQLDADTTNGTATARIVVRGVDSSGTPFTNESSLSNRVHIRCVASSFTGTYMLNHASQRWMYKCLWFDCRDSGGTSRAPRAAYFTSTGYGTRVHNCEFSHSADGYACVRLGYNDEFTLLDVHDGGAVGIYTASSTPVLRWCRIYNNASDGVRIDNNGNYGGVYECLIYGNGANGIYQSDTGEEGVDIVGNLVYGNTNDGIKIGCYPYRGNGGIYNNTCVSNGGYGFNLTHANAFDPGMWYDRMDFNHTHNNTSGACNGTLPGQNNQTGDPLFASTTGGSEDFTPGTGSPLLAAALATGSA